MGRQISCGTVEFVEREGERGYWRAAVTFPRALPLRPKRERHWFRLDAGEVRTEAAARAAALQLNALARAGRLSPPAEALPTARARPWSEIPDRTPAGLETVKGWSARWSDERRRRGWKSVRADEARLRTWIWPRLGALAMVHVQRSQIEAVSEWLDDQVLAEALSWKSALNVWSLLSKLFHDAAHGKPRALRVRALQGDPTENVAPPDRGARKGKQFLYPSEVDRLLRSEAVPLAVRQVYAVAVFLYPRAGELEALDCDDVDLVHGTVLIHRARNADTGEIGETKGNRPRRVPIHPHLWPLLAHLVRLAGGKGLLWPDFPCWKDRAGQLRKYLERAGVDRAELLVGSDTSKVMGFHDLRATGITWEAIAGTEAMKIQQRAGHTTLSTTLIYVRLADEVRGVRFGVPFSPLPASLVSPVIESRIESGRREEMTLSAAKPIENQGFGVRDSNPLSGYRDDANELETGLRASRDLPPGPPPRTDATPRDRAGLNGGANPSEAAGSPEAAVRAAVVAALEGDDLTLAGELLEVLRRRGAAPGTPGVAKVIDLNDHRARKEGPGS